jgi:hypothetical protein
MGFASFFPLEASLPVLEALLLKKREKKTGKKKKKQPIFSCGF